MLDDDMDGFDFVGVYIIFNGSEWVYLVIFKWFVEWFGCFNFVVVVLWFVYGMVEVMVYIVICNVNELLEIVDFEFEKLFVG